MRILGWLVLVVVAVAAVFVGALLFLPGERIARIAADQIEAQTGRAVTLTGEAEVTWYPVLGVTTGPIEMANAPWSDKGPMFRAEGLRIGVDAKTVFSDEIRVTELRAIRPEILLERNAEGAANWNFGGAGGSGGSATTAPADTSGPGLHLDRLEVTNATLRMIAPGEETAYRDVDLTIDWPASAGPVDVAMTLRPAGEPITLTTRLAALEPLLAGETVPLEFTATGPGGTMTFSGKASSAPTADGRIEAELANLASFTRALGLGAVEMPAGFGPSAAFTGQMALAGDSRLALRDGNLRMGEARAQVRADVDYAAKPRVSAEVTMDRLDLAPMLVGQGTGAGGGGGGATGWSQAPIDVSALSVLDGEIAFAANTVDLGDIELGPVRTTTRIDNARAVTDLAQVGAFGGSLGGQFIINNRSGLSMGGDLSATGVDLKRMLGELADVQRITGTGEARVTFLTSGSSMHALMNALSGEGRISTGRGTFEGIDLDRLFRAGDATGGTTIFDSIDASFRMENGSLFNDDLALQLASLRAEGKGRIGLGPRDIDYLFTPISLKARDGRGIAIPVRIRGPWSDPAILPDLEAAVKLNLDEERQALEQRAEDKVLEKLGVEKQQGERAEDAVRRRLEEEALKGLGRLLGGN
ncbi:AsmA family protein [Pseudooceanicola sp.]|uniref:AsmA family protein n=1 Tax=Pseudooceanicola sp. TaxID=1914328 RepID=UPI00351663C8